VRGEIRHPLVDLRAAARNRARVARRQAGEIKPVALETKRRRAQERREEEAAS
jgi:hypothetical protein